MVGALGDVSGVRSRIVGARGQLTNLLHSFATDVSADQGADGGFARASVAAWESVDGVWAAVVAGVPRVGDGAGLRLAPTTVNEAYRNIDPQPGDAALALTLTGGVASEENDLTALAAEGCSTWGPAVYQVVNATGAAVYVRMSAQTGDVDPRSLQMLIRRTAGAGDVNLGLYDEGAGTFVAGVAIHDGYDARTLVHGQVPADTDCTMCLEIADGVTVRFTAMGMEKGPRVTSPIPNSAVANTETRVSDDFTASATPPNAEGAIELYVTPMGWSGAEVNGAGLVWTVWGAQSTLRVTPAGVWEVELDGTNTITTTSMPADGVEQYIRLGWSVPGGIVLSIDGEVWTSPYDGTIRWAGAWQLLAQYAEFLVRGFRVLRNSIG